MVVMGLDFLVEDNIMFDYVKKFGGKIVSEMVIYGKDKQGPFRGMLNGERKYLIDMSEAVCGMGTYHYIGNNKVKILYRGNSKTCGRCHEEANRYPGRGIANKCDNERTPLDVHMRRLNIRVEKLKEQQQRT